VLDKYTDVVFKPGVPPVEGGYPGLDPRTEKTRGMVIEYDVEVPMRDGVKIYADIYRPDQPGRFPPIVAWGPYGKQGRVLYSYLGNTGLRDEEFNEFTKFEAPDPVYWCGHGYVVMNVDSRGSWASEGDLTWMSEQEVDDMYDLIEWAGAQGWSNGRVGMMGVSYLAWSQWKVAAAGPPHLAAIIPWEGVSDFYREFAFHGGIRETLFCPMWQSNVKFSTGQVEDFLAMQKLHPLYDGYWKSKNADLSKITVPALVVASWTDHGLHNRGTLEGFRQISSKHKWLIVHGRKKWWHFYKMESVEKQRQFFNRFLKGIELDNHVLEWPRVTLEIREKYYVGEDRTENEWPLARTQHTKYFLDAANAGLTATAPKAESSVRYNADRDYDVSDDGRFSPFYDEAVKELTEARPTGEAADRRGAAGGLRSARFEMEFKERTELTGYIALRLWVQADGSDDMDLFVALDKIDKAGFRVPMAFFGNHDDGPVALGWLRASHRELDEARSTPWQPWHSHAREIKLGPGEIVPVDIEIWPTCILFEAGEKLRLTVQGSDIYWYPSEGHTDGHLDTLNRGDHIIHTGGKSDSHLLAPVIPPKEAS
jgi:predicted acyl esterase